MLAAVERIGRPTMADLWDQFPDLAPSAIKRVLDSLEKKGLVAHSGDERQVYLNGVHWWSTALGPTAPDPQLEVILAALRNALVDVEHHADGQERCVTAFVPLVEIEADLQGLPSATLDRLRTCVRELEASGAPIHLRIAEITAGPEPLVAVKLQATESIDRGA